MISSMGSIRFIAKRDGGDALVVSLSPGVNILNSDDFDLIGFMSPYYEDGEVKILDGEKEIFSSKDAKEPFFELALSIRKIGFAKAVFLVPYKKQKEIVEHIASLSPKKGEDEQSNEDRVSGLLKSLKEENCLYLSFDLDERENRGREEELLKLFSTSRELPIVFKRRNKPHVRETEIGRYERLGDVYPPINLGNHLRNEWFTYLLLALFGLLSGIGAALAGAVFSVSDFGMGAFLVVLVVLIASMYGYVYCSLVAAYLKERGVQYIAVGATASLLVGYLVSLGVNYLLGSFVDGDAFDVLFPMSAYGILVVLILSIFSLLVAFLLPRKRS